MTTNDSGRAANAEPALVSDQAPSGLGPTGFDPARIERAAEAIMRARVKFGWTFGKRARVLGIDLIMAEAALRADGNCLPPPGGES